MSREANIALVVHDGQHIYAGIGVHEPLARPTVTVSARAGRRRAAAADGPGSAADAAGAGAGAWLVGDALDAALARGEQLELVAPLATGDVCGHEWDALAALWYHVVVEQLGIAPGANESFTLLALPVPISRLTYERAAQVFFERLNVVALCVSETPLLSAYAAGVLTAAVVGIGEEATTVAAVNDCAVYYPSAVVTRVGAVHCTYYLAHVLAQEAGVADALRSVPEGERGAALFALAEQLVHDGHVRVDVGNVGVADAPAEADEEGAFDVATALVEGRERDVVAEHAQTKAGPSGGAGAAGRDSVTVTFRGMQVPVGRARLRFHEPLLRPAVLAQCSLSPVPPAVRSSLETMHSGSQPPCVSLPEALAQSIGKVPSHDRRVALWESLVVTGHLARAKGLVNELLRACATQVSSEPTEATQVVGEPNPMQPRAVRALKVPDYFSEFKERADLVSFLGATIFGKLVFGDLSGRNYITKTQYNEAGPSVAFTAGSG